MQIKGWMKVRDKAKRETGGMGETSVERDDGTMGLHGYARPEISAATCSVNRRCLNRVIKSIPRFRCSAGNILASARSRSLRQRINRLMNSPSKCRARVTFSDALARKPQGDAETSMCHRVLFFSASRAFASTFKEKISRQSVTGACGLCGGFFVA